MSTIKKQRALIASLANGLKDKTIKGGMILKGDVASDLDALIKTLDENQVDTILTREEQEAIKEEKRLAKKEAIKQRLLAQTENRVDRQAKILASIEEKISEQSKRISTHTVKMGQVKRHTLAADHSKAQVQKGVANRNTLREERAIRRSKLAQHLLEERRLKREARQMA